jgi:hypothetical protein
VERENRNISIAVLNPSEVTAEHVTSDFLADINATNIVANNWFLEPKSDSGENHWREIADSSYGQYEAWHPNTITISTNFNQPFLAAKFLIHADRSKTFQYFVVFTFGN